MLGLHWVCDLAGCAPERLVAERVHEALIEVPHVLGLNTVGPPQLFEHRDAERGTSIAGIVLLRESHASCHCFPNAGLVHLDVFCCRRVDFEPAARFVTRHFASASTSDRVLERGAHGGSLGVVRAVR
jgi:S-adenosylmethionine decarboxylase